MTDNTVRSEVTRGVATITLNRPDQLNALNEAVRRELLQALTAAESNPEVRVVVMTGAGRGFCVGQDLAAESELADCHDCVDRTYNPVVEQLARLDKPVIAAVNGAAVGAGMGFALGCDLILMAEGSFFSCAFGKVGLCPDSGASYYLSRILGHYRAFEIAATGRRIMADEAVALGLANRVVPADKLLSEAHALAQLLCGESAKALLLTKQLLRDAAESPLQTVIEREALAQGVAGQTPEHLARRAAFLAKGKK